jgi:hypothetical protein
MIEKAVIDRFEGQYAILLVGKPNRQIDVLKKFLPAGAKEGTWLKIDVSDDGLKSVEIDNKETSAAQKRISDKLAALRRGDQLKGKSE